MESFVFFFIVFLWCLFLSIIGYLVYVGFGLFLKDFCDLFEEYED